MQQLDDRVVKMYRSIAGILRKYRSGKLPKAFKIIPALNNWEQVGKTGFFTLTHINNWIAGHVVFLLLTCRHYFDPRPHAHCVNVPPLRKRMRCHCRLRRYKTNVT